METSTVMAGWDRDGLCKVASPVRAMRVHARAVALLYSDDDVMIHILSAEA